MALYTTFGELLTMTRVEARLSPNPAVSSEANTRYKAIINRVYATLYDDYDWSHLRYTAPRFALAAGQRFYDFPIGLNFNKIEKVTAWWGENPYLLDPSIGPKEYAAFDSVTNERSDPPLRYDIRSEAAGQTQFEVWPLPASDQASIEITGIRALAKLVNPIDICLLDDHMVSLYAASEILAPISQADSEKKMQAANARRSQLRARAVPATGSGDTAPTVGNGTGARFELHKGRATVTIGVTGSGDA